MFNIHTASTSELIERARELRQLIQNGYGMPKLTTRRRVELGAIMSMLEANPDAYAQALTIPRAK